MSKETYVGGDIIETTGGNNLSYAKDIIENIGIQVIQDGKDNGVFYGINKDAPNFTSPAVTFAYIAKIKDNNYVQIKSASVGDTVYVVVRTVGLIGRNVEVNLINSDGILSGKDYAAIDLLQDDKDVNGLLSTTVNEDGLAVYKVKLQPTTDIKDVKLWSEKIKDTKSKKTNLCILVDARKNNPDLKIIYLGKNPKGQENRSLKADKENYWHDGDGKWFEVKMKDRKVCPLDKRHRSHFVIHCTAGNMSENSIKTHTKYDTKSKTRSKAHKYIMPDGKVIEIWPFTETNVWATKAESKLNLKGQMFHVEINYGAPSIPSDQQYNALAKLYIEAADTQDCWPIIVPHIEIDRGLPNGHSDPTDFNYNKFYAILKSMDVPIEEIPHFEHSRYWGSPSYKIPMGSDENSWPPILKGNPHK